MSSVKDVRQQLAKMQREMEAKELELYRAQAQPLLDSFVDYLLNDKEICQKLKNYNKEEIRLIAAQFVKDFDRITAECADEIEAARQKRAERAAKRKAKETAAANVGQSPVQEGVPSQMSNQIVDHKVIQQDGREVHVETQPNGEQLIWREHIPNRQ